MGRAWTAWGLSLAVLTAAGAAAAQPAAGDPARGRAAFGQCSACHVLNGTSTVGPPLAGVIGRKAGTFPGFRFSKAMAASGIVWTEQALDRFLADPNKTVPGNSMAIGLPSAQQRADVIAYLKTVPAAP